MPKAFAKPTQAASFGWRRLWLVPILFCMGAASPSFAQDLDYDPDILSLCLENAENLTDRTSCIGRGAAECIVGEAGQSTIGLGYCYSAEWEDWDTRLNTTYTSMRSGQAELAEDNAAFNANIPNATDAMRDMQRAWITYRDAACQWEAIQWSGGTGAGPASAQCMMRLTAQQTLFLQEYSY